MAEFDFKNLKIAAANALIDILPPGTQITAEPGIKDDETILKANIVDHATGDVRSVSINVTKGAPSELQSKDFGSPVVGSYYVNAGAGLRVTHSSGENIVAPDSKGFLLVDGRVSDTAYADQPHLSDGLHAISKTLDWLDRDNAHQLEDAIPQHISNQIIHTRETNSPITLKKPIPGLFDDPKNPVIQGQELKEINKVLSKDGTFETRDKASQVISDVAGLANDTTASPQRRREYKSVLANVEAAHPEAVAIAVQEVKKGKDHGTGPSNEKLVTTIEEAQKALSLKTASNSDGSRSKRSLGPASPQ